MPYRPTSLLAKAIILIAVMLAGAGSWAQLPAKGGAATSAVVTTPHVRAELIAHAPQGVEPGQPLWLGLQITHQPEWHTYWKNPGDSGLPIEMAWTLPAGLDAGEIAWPLPKKISIGTLANYGYEGTVLLPVPVTVASTFAPKALNNAALYPVAAPISRTRSPCSTCASFSRRPVASGGLSARPPARGIERST